MSGVTLYALAWQRRARFGFEFLELGPGFTPGRMLLVFRGFSPGLRISKSSMNARGLGRALISQKVSIKLFCKSQFRTNLSIYFTQVTIENKLTDLCVNYLLQNDFINTF